MAGFSASTFALLKKLVEQTMTGAGAIKGQKGDKGDAGTIAINSVKTLPAGSEATVENVGTDSAAKLNIGIPQGETGPKGKTGDTGETGKSAYEMAKLNGYTGTVTEWLASLKGADGKDGATGAAGKDGKTGANGKSAYEIAVEQGYTGTEAEWIGSLKGKQGEKGETGKDGADGKSFTIQAQFATEADLKAAHPTGNAGDAYYVGENTSSSRPDVYIWLAESNEWYNQGPISGVKGDDGASGKSAYELAEENGYSGSESEWLASLKGAKGDKGDKGIAGAKGDKGDTGATGKKGDKGEKGDAATIKVGKVVSGEAGTEAVVANSGTTSDAVFDFTIPRGDKGDKGDTGEAVAPYERKDITSRIGELSAAIASGNPEKYDFREGYYFNGASKYEYLLSSYCHFHGQVNNGAVIKDRHWGVIVNTKKTHAWNSSGKTTGGYSASELDAYLQDEVLTNVKSDLTALFGDDWSNHLIANNKLLSNAVDETYYNRFGTASGAASSWTWFNGRYIVAPSEIEIYGSIAWSSSGYDTGEACHPLQAFQRFRFNELLGNTSPWLRDVSSASSACLAVYNGVASYPTVSDAWYVLGLIAIK